MNEPTRALVVDDDPSVRDLLANLLESEGYVVTTAQDGQRGLEELERSNPNVVLLDWIMPVMGGLEFRQAQLRNSELAKIPVIVLTASRDVETQVKELRPAAWLYKPFDVDDLVSTLEAVAHSTN